MPNEIHVGPSGPYHAPAAAVGGEASAEVWLCRCGQSQNKPFCDGSHRAAGFADPGTCAAAEVAELTEVAALEVRPAPNGPLLVSGGVEVRDASGAVVFRGAKAALCRCGQSATKPFCDGTHRKVGFQAP
ncbi:MAG: CDGSH iron-sulfur domain-containing protein [Myxococcota bacterium]